MTAGAATGAAFDPHGDLWLVSQGTGSFSELTAPQLTSSGQKVPAVTISGIASPNGIAIDRRGDIWVSSFGGSLYEFTPAQVSKSGSPTAAVVISSTVGDLSGAARLAFDRLGDLWVVDYGADKAVEYSPRQLAATGAPVPTVVLSSSSFSEPNGLGFDGAGNLWVVNEGTPSVVEFSPDQLQRSGAPTPVKTIEGTSTGLTNPWVLAVSPDSKMVYVGNAGNTVTAYPTSGSGDLAPSQTLSRPGNVGSLAFSASGYLWVGSTGGTSNGALSAYSYGSGPSGPTSTIASGLPSPLRAFSPLSSDVVNAGIALALALFITFPGNLFNQTFEENYEDIASWWSKWLGILIPPSVRRSYKSLLEHFGALVRRLEKGRVGTEKEGVVRGWTAFATVLVIGSVLGALLDPHFGLNYATFLSFVSIVIAMVAGVALSGTVTGAYHRARGHGRVTYRPEALPMGLLVAASCVVISRLTGFQPGYLYGVICGIAFNRELAPKEEGHVVALGSWVRVIVGIAAWFLWDAINHYASRSGSFFGAVLADDFLASLFVSGLVGTVISLLPLEFLPGNKLRAWHKGVWAVTFAVTLFVLVQVLLRPHATASGHSHVPLVTTLVLFALFGVGSLVFRQHFAKKHRRPETATEERALAANVANGQEGSSTSPAAAVGSAGTSAAGP